MKLSIVFGGRNDNYGGNFAERVLRALDRNMAEAQAHGVDIEWIWVEWNPPDEDYLAYTLAPMGVTCYIVDPAIHAHIIHPKYVEQMPWHEGFAKNVGIRRAQGDWVLTTSPDVVYGQAVWDFWRRGKFDRETLYRAERHDVDCQYFDQPFAVIQEHVVARHKVRTSHMTNASGDFIMCLTAHNMGHDEDIDYAGTHLDGHFMVNWLYEIELLAGPVYKADHPLIGCTLKLTDLETWLYHHGQPSWDYKFQYGNPPGWGFIEYPSHQLADGITYIEEVCSVHIDG